MQRILLTTLAVTFFLWAQAQENTPADTLAIAQKLAWNKEFKEANALLQVYNSHHRDADGLRLQAQVLHWMGRSGEAIALLRPAIIEFSSEPAIQLDYARILFESGHINQALTRYQQYLKADSSNPEALLHTAFIDRWNGKTASAKQGAESFLVKYPGNKSATELLTQMRLDATPWIRFGAGYLSDDQPLQTASASLEAGWYKNWWLSPQLFVRWNNMEANGSNSSLQAQLFNQFYIGSTGTTLLAAAGLAQQNGEQEATAKIGINQKILRHLHVDASWEKRAYQHTATSTQQLLMQQFTQFSVKYNKHDKWMGQASMEMQQFDDNNKVQTIYAWALIPVLQGVKWRISTGYAIAFADADSNTFRPSKSLSQIVATGGPITGIYDPYFTPTNQLTHSLLLSGYLTISPSVKWQARASAAFAGKADNPYFYPNRTNGNQFTIVKSYYQENYLPIDFYTELSWKASKLTLLQLYYQYSRLLFYNRHITGITLKFPLSNGGQ